MTKKTFQTRKTILTVIATFIFAVSFAATAWATVSLVQPKDAVEMHDGASVAQIPTEHEETKQSRAPEPSTLALFGSGLIGMIGSFVRRTYEVTKRIFDVTAAILGFIILSPLLILTAIAVKLTSKGPIIYKQTRVGQYGRYFTIYKFRSMCQDAEKGTGAVWAKTNDSRLSPIGKILRKSHVDELPQLFNILKGEMSLIGPRPERPKFVKQFKKDIPDYEKRLFVKPGITGLAQVWWRYDESFTDVKKKLKYDLLYIKNVCLTADLNILLRTVRVVFTGEGAK